MPSFVENAILRLTDQTSGKARRINRELKKLEATARRLSKTSGNVKLTGLTKATVDARKLNVQLAKAVRLSNQLRRGINVKVNTGNATRSVNALAAAKAKLRAPTTLKLNTGAARRALLTLNAAKKRLAAPVALRTAVTPGRPATSKQNAAARITVPRSTAGMFNPLRGIFRDGAQMMKYAIIAGLASGLKKGVISEDVANDALRTQELSKNDYNRVLIKAVKSTEKSPFLNPSMYKKMVADFLPTVSGDTDKALRLAEATKPLINAMARKGIPAENVANDMRLLIKAWDSAQMITNRKTGELNMDMVKKNVSLEMRMMRAQQEDWSAALSSSLIKHLGVSKFGVNENARLRLAFLGEQLRERAATGYNQLLRVLSGGIKNKTSLATLSRYGLMQLKEVKSGTVGKKKRTTTTVAGVTDINLLNKDMGAWIKKYLIPAAKKFDNLNLRNVDDLRTFLPQIGGRIVAKESLGALAIGQANLERDIRRAKLYDVSPQKEAEITAQSMIRSIVGVSSQGQGLFGIAVAQFNKEIIAAGDSMSNTLNKASAFILGDEKTTPTERKIRAGVAVGGAGLAGVGLVVGAKKLLTTFGLGASATALTGSATALTGAAAALTRAAAVQGLGGKGGIGGVAGKVKGSVPSATPATGVFSVAGWAALGTAAGALAAGVYGDSLARSWTKHIVDRAKDALGFKKRTPEEEKALNKARDMGPLDAWQHFMGNTSTPKKKVENPFVQWGNDYNKMLRNQGARTPNANKALVPGGLLPNFNLSKGTFRGAATGTDLAGGMGSEASAKFEAAFGDLSVLPANIANEMANAAPAFGTTAGQGMMPFATQFGQQAGAAIAAAAANINVNVASNTKTPDTGTTKVLN